MRSRAALAVVACMMAVPFASQAATCEWAKRYANDMIELANKSRASLNDVQARVLARDSRPIAVDAAKEAKQCGCDAAIRHFEEAGLQASYANNAYNLTAIHQYAARTKASSEKALEALRLCGP